VRFAACYRFRVDRRGLPRAEQGAALVTAVLVVAIATIIAVSLMSRQNFDTRRTANIIHRDQAMAYAFGVERWSSIELGKDAQANEYDHSGERWATDLPPLPIEGGYLDGKLADIQGRFDLNSVLIQLQAARFTRLCQSLNVDPGFIPALQDWIDGDIDPRPNGAEDETYTMYDPPYRTANRMLGHHSELLLVKGVSVEDYDKLSAYVSALPESTGINVNTASAPLLQSLVEDVAFGDATGLVEQRESLPYTNIDTFAEEPAFDGKGLSKDYLTVSSQYFLLTTDVVLGDTQLTLQSLLHRKEQGQITVLQRRLGPPRERVLAAAEDFDTDYQNEMP